MDPEVMWAVAAAVVALPFLLLVAFNGRNVADSRGRRLDRGWHLSRQERI